MSYMHAAFGIAASIAVLSTVLVITGTNAVHALLCLILSLLSVAVLLFLLGAPFAAALEVIIYAGAIMVMFVFVIMTMPIKESMREEERELRVSGWAAPLAMGLILFGEIYYVLSQSAALAKASMRVIEPKQVGLSLFGPYLLGVEAAALLLLAASIGAIHLGRRDSSGSRKGLRREPVELKRKKEVA